MRVAMKFNEFFYKNYQLERKATGSSKLAIYFWPTFLNIKNV